MQSMQHNKTIKQMTKVKNVKKIFCWDISKGKWPTHLWNFSFFFCFDSHEGMLHWHLDICLFHMWSNKIQRERERGKWWKIKITTTNSWKKVNKNRRNSVNVNLCASIFECLLAHHFINAKIDMASVDVTVCSYTFYIEWQLLFFFL